MKPIVKIQDCSLLYTLSSNKMLTGIPMDYPDEHQAYPGCLSNGRRVYTSKVVSVEGNTVETLRTIYEVQNWLEEFV